MNTVSSISPCFFLFLSLSFQFSNSQQPYVGEDNNQLDCYTPHNSSNGNICNGPPQWPSCLSYVTFRSQPPYDTATQISYLLNSEPSSIAELNNITDVDKIPTDTVIIVPITNCSCSGKYYQHNSSYILKYDSENYYTLANCTYQGITTCQALINQNPKHDSRNLYVGIRLSVPVRCACPSRKQTANGIRFLLSYLITWGDTISSISEAFGVDVQSTLDANQLLEDSLIYPFTPVLVPLKTKPTYSSSVRSQSPSLPPTISVVPSDDEFNLPTRDTKKWVFVGVGVGLAVVVILFLGLLLWFWWRRSSQPTDYSVAAEKKPELELGVVSSKSVGHLIDSSLNVYDFKELQRATGHFNEDNRIKGSVYRGVITGDYAAIKRMKGDATNEINILNHISHSSVVRLSGYCTYEGNAYVVYEFAKNGSLSDWLHGDGDKSCKSKTPGGGRLAWKERIQIAYDVADGLNYLHNYATPPYIHKDLKSSNILLDDEFRAKIANFGNARTVNEEQEGDGVLQMTRHVVGSQGYMPPEYMENGVVTPKMDVFAFGVVLLELLSGKEAVTVSVSNINDGKKVKGEGLLFASITKVPEGENVREKLRDFIDPYLGSKYPLDLGFSLAQLANKCVADDLDSRPTMFGVFMSLSKIHSSSLDWDPSGVL